MGFLADMQPEFDDQGSRRGQRTLQPRPELHPPVEVVLIQTAATELSDGFAVPAAEKDGHFTLARQRAPVAPGFGTLLFLVGFQPEGMGADILGVHPFRQQVDHRVLAHAVHAFNDHQHRHIALTRPTLRGEQPSAQFFLERAVFFGRIGSAQGCGFKHSLLPLYRAAAGPDSGPRR